MKRTKKLIAGLMATTMLLSMGTACGGGGAGNSADAQYENRQNRIDLMIFNGGYGYEWMKDVAKYYMDNVDQDTYVNVKPTVMNASELSKIQAGLATYDIYMLDGGIDDIQDVVYDLTNVVKGYPTGETKYTIEEKMSAWTHYYKNSNGSYYTMPWTSSLGFSFMYNETSINEALGEGTWVLPRTTKEFFELGDRLLENDMYLYSAAYGDQYDYLHWGQQVWLAQAMGFEAYQNFFQGNYKDGDEWKFAEDYPHMITQNEENIKSYYEVLYTLGLPGNNYIHANSNVMSFTDIEAVFAGYGYGRNPAKTAFIFEGPWGESEVNLVCQTVSGKPCQDTIGAMKMPINSQIISRTPTIKDDAKLREVIDYVDDIRRPKPADVSDADIAIVSEARRMVGQGMSAKIMIPLSSKKVDLAKKFLQFLATDKAQGVAMDAKNGINVLPYNAKEAVSGTKPLTNYSKTLQEVTREAIFISLYNEEYDFARVTGFAAYPNTATIMNGIASMSSASMVPTPQDFYTQLLNANTSTWSTKIKTYKTYMGI